VWRRGPAGRARPARGRQQCTPGAPHKRTCRQHKHTHKHKHTSTHAHKYTTNKQQTHNPQERKALLDEYYGYGSCYGKPAALCALALIDQASSGLTMADLWWAFGGAGWGVARGQDGRGRGARGGAAGRGREATRGAPLRARQRAARALPWRRAAPTRARPPPALGLPQPRPAPSASPNPPNDPPNTWNPPNHGHRAHP
jgi:hypothetical protein